MWKSEVKQGKGGQDRAGLMGVVSGEVEVPGDKARGSRGVHMVTPSIAPHRCSAHPHPPTPFILCSRHQGNM